MTSPPGPAFPKGVAAPAIRALTAAGYTELGQLVGVPASELRKLHGVGPKALRLIGEALEERAGGRTKDEAWAAVESALLAEDSPGSSMASILDDLGHERR